MNLLRLTLLLLTLIILATGTCSAAVRQPGNFIIDEITWYKQIISARPGLLDAQEQELERSLLLRPIFRSLVLTPPNSANTIMATYYNASADRVWVAAQQEASKAMTEDLHKQFHQTHPHGTNAEFKDWLVSQEIVKPAAYNKDEYVGYVVGRGSETVRHEGLGYKVYFTFADAYTQLSSAQFIGFSQALLKAGFRGDLRIETSPGSAFLHYDQLSVHTASAAWATYAEAAGKSYFGGRIVHVARGLDQGNTDWHAYLIRNKGRLTDLSSEAQAYVQNEN